MEIPQQFGKSKQTQGTRRYTTMRIRISVPDKNQTSCKTLGLCRTHSDKMAPCAYFHTLFTDTDMCILIRTTGIAPTYLTCSILAGYGSGSCNRDVE